jgi:hypothetical protein
MKLAGNMLNKLFFLNLILIISACSNVQEYNFGIDVPNEKIIKFCADISSSSGSSVELTEKAFRKLDEVVFEKVSIKHDEKLINRRVFLKYRDGYVSIYELPDYNLNHLESAKYTESFRPHALEKTIGNSAIHTKELLGVPNQESQHELFYYCSYLNSSSIALKIENNSIHAVVINK